MDSFNDQYSEDLNSVIDAPTVLLSFISSTYTGSTLVAEYINSSG